MKTQKQISQNYLIRAVAGADHNYPVQILQKPENANKPPKFVGESYGWKKIRGKNAGERVSAAYAKKWWGNVQYVSSTLRVECGPKMAERLMKEIQNPPAGMTVIVKNFALEFRRLSDGMDYHCPAKILLEKDWRGQVRREMAKNYNQRLQSKREQKRKEKEQEIFARESLSCRVTFADSRQAGNCVEGTLQFAEKKLGLTREEIFNGGHLISIAVPLLRRAANGDSARVESAIRAAWNRETLVCI